MTGEEVRDKKGHPVTLMPRTVMNVLTVRTANDIIITINLDGTIVRGPAFTTEDQESLRFWDMIAQIYPVFRERIERETEARVRAEYESR